MADADPPHEIGDGKAPTNGNIQSPDSDAAYEKNRHADQKQQRERESKEQAQQPRGGGFAAQNDRADFIRDGRVREIGINEGGFHSASSGFRLRTLAR